jgi:murein DD-endopeptidase MepM/ murein hydrolase activator NlpD
MWGWRAPGGSSPAAVNGSIRQCPWTWTTTALGATARARIILTFSVRDFVVLARRYPHQGGIVLAAQSS